MNDSEPLELCIENRAIHLPENFPVEAKNSVFVTTSSRGCLMLYQMHDWGALRDKLFTVNLDSERARLEVRSVIANVEECEVGRGRNLVLSGHLAQVGQLSNRVLWVPRDNHIELWNPRLFIT